MKNSMGMGRIFFSLHYLYTVLVAKQLRLLYSLLRSVFAFATEWKLEHDTLDDREVWAKILLAVRGLCTRLENDRYSRELIMAIGIPVSLLSTFSASSPQLHSYDRFRLRLNRMFHRRRIEFGIYVRGKVGGLRLRRWRLTREKRL